MTAIPARTPATGVDRALARDRLWSALEDGDEYTAGAVVLTAVDEGLAPEDVLMEVIAPVQREVGAEWAAGRLSVAREHAATAINDRVVAALAHHVRPGPDVPPAGRVTVACVDGEWHALPARLVAEVLRLRGWRVDFLGAQVPAPHLISHLHLTAPDAVALSSSLATRLPTAHAAITACQAAGVPVLAGGAAFGADGRYARLLGADAWAPDARTAADLLAAGLPGRSGTPVPRAPALLPHLQDQEYTLVSRSARQLVRGTLAGLEERFPPLRAYTAAQRGHTVDDLAQIVDFLATALYTDDPGLFTGFLTWTADILAARHVPPRSLLPALDALHEQLKDFPRALRLIDEAGRALGAHLDGTATKEDT